MPFTVHVQREGGFVRFAVAGHASLKNYFDLIDDAARATAAAGDTLVLVDIRGVIGRLHVNDQLFIGEVAAEKLVHLRKVATLVPEDPATYNSEKSAAQKGLGLRTFAVEAEAIGWLLTP